MTHLSVEFKKLKELALSQGKTTPELLEPRLRTLQSMLRTNEGQMVVAVLSQKRHSGSQHDPEAKSMKIQAGIITHATTFPIKPGMAISLTEFLYNVKNPVAVDPRSEYPPKPRYEHDSFDTIGMHTDSITSLYYMDERARHSRVPQLSFHIGDKPATRLLSFALPAYQYEAIGAALGRKMPPSPVVRRKANAERYSLYDTLFNLDREFQYYEKATRRDEDTDWIQALKPQIAYDTGANYIDSNHDHTTALNCCNSAIRHVLRVATARNYHEDKRVALSGYDGRLVLSDFGRFIRNRIQLYEFIPGR